MKTVLIDTLELASGVIYVIIAGRRYRMSDCTVKAELYEQTEQLAMLGGCGLKKQKISIVICGDVDSSGYDLSSASGLEVSAEILRADGIYEKVFFHDLIPMELIEHGAWRLEVNNHEQVKRLFELASV